MSPKHGLQISLPDNPTTKAAAGNPNGGHGSGTGGGTTLDFGYVPVDIVGQVERNELSSAALRKLTTRRLCVTNNGALPAVLTRVDIIPDDGVFAVVAETEAERRQRQHTVGTGPGEAGGDDAAAPDAAPDTVESGLFGGGKGFNRPLSVTLGVGETATLIVHMRPRPDTLRFFAAWVAVHCEYGRTASMRVPTMFDTVSLSCVIARKAVAVAIRSNEIKALNAEAYVTAPHTHTAERAHTHTLGANCNTLLQYPSVLISSL